MPDTEYDIATLQEGTVDSILEKLGDLSLPQLRSLDQLERERKGDKARSTLLDPIADEITKREAAGEGAGLAGDAATGSASAPGADDARSQPAPDSAVRSYSQDELDAIVSEKERQWAADRASLEARLASAAEEVARIDGAPTDVVAAVSAQPLALHEIGFDWIDDVTKHGAFIVFVDDADRALPETVLPMMAVAGSAFETISGSMIYLGDIEFPVHGVQTEVAGAFLLDDDGDPLAKAELAPVVRVGGGTPHKLPGRSLYFSRPAG
ncbi:hypothetical protein S2M10_29410 [Sphingomonas sp. S2M10]|uniref:hypothetical protein n=1 Tax=Sphingomonas sp. S2M10 TaxID=2705010 RepID=UPI001456568F|nr:hypothetical protein [Sphingomonas sp. S2M10]NLS27939.1 hypothetical protein [Sphingomonas sp. S2M10]